jgi:hypothetical protein
MFNALNSSISFAGGQLAFSVSGQTPRPTGRSVSTASNSARPCRETVVSLVLMTLQRCQLVFQFEKSSFHAGCQKTLRLVGDWF